LIKSLQVGKRHAHVAYRRGAIREIQGNRGQIGHLPADTQQDRFHIEAGFTATALDSALHLLQRMIRQEMQYPHIVLDPSGRSVLALQSAAQLIKDGRELPAAKDVGVVQGGGPPLQGVQVMVGIQHLLVPTITTRMRGDDLAATDQLHALDICFDRDGLEGSATRHTVAVAVITDHLVLIRLGRLHDTGIKGVGRQ
jgi:hypothetical protein